MRNIVEKIIKNHSSQGCLGGRIERCRKSKYRKSKRDSENFLLAEQIGKGEFSVETASGFQFCANWMLFWICVEHMR